MSKINMGINDIKKYLPHDYPMLFVDRIIEFEPYEYMIGIKGISYNEPVFQGHFPDYPIFPGVFIVESLAQLGFVFASCSMEVDAKNAEKVSMENRVVLLMSIEKAKFRRQVIPGDLMVLHISRQKSRGFTWKFKGVCKVDGKVAVETVFTAMLKL